MTTKYTYDTKYKQNNKYICKIQVLNCDILSVADSSLLLNMANKYTPGGFYKTQKGMSGQEEYIFKNTDIKIPDFYYPIKDDEVLVTVGVCWKDLTFDVISCPSLDMRNRKFGQVEKLIMYRKIDTIFQVGEKLNYRKIVLSALGCGSYTCPPEIVSKIFKDVLQEYKNSFDTVIFAIKDEEQHPMSNYNIFKRELLS